MSFEKIRHCWRLKMKKFLTAAIIISLGILGAYLIIQKPGSASFEVSFKEQNSKSTDNNLIKGVSLLPSTKQDLRNETAPEENTSQNSQNLTELTVKEITDALAQKNPTGPEIIEGEKWLNAINPDEFAQELITKAAQNFNPDSLKPVIKNEDLKISDDNSKEALTSYFSDFNTIIKQAAGQMPRESITDSSKISLETVGQLINVYQLSLDNLKQIKAPSSLLSFHKKELELLGLNINIYKKIQNYQNDPLTTMLAAKELENTNLEFENLKNEVIDFIKKSGIVI